jgi:hypothetical protein
MVETEAEPRASIEHTEPHHVHVEEQSQGLSRNGREDHILEYSASERPTVLTRSNRPQALGERAGLTSPLRLQFSVAHMLSQPCCKALAILVDDVVPETLERTVDADELAHDAAIELGVSPVNETDYP